MTLRRLFLPPSRPRCSGLANGNELTMNIQMIPLSQLVPSEDNFRKTGVNEGIESLAASLRVHGLLHNLRVRHSETKNVCEKAI
jgi:hypothetical protein